MYPVLFELGPLKIYSYGLLIVLGGILSSGFLYKRRARMGMSREEDFWLLINVLLFGGFIGGRLLFLIEYVPLSSPDFWAQALSPNRGLSVYGAFLGITAGVILFSRRAGLEPLKVLDYVCQVAPFWHAFGRLGCFFAGCCHGRPAGEGSSWAVIFRHSSAQVPDSLLGVPLYPTQLYEAGGDLVLAAGLFILVLPRLEKGRLPSGMLCAAYMAGYAVLRFILEYYRGDTVEWIRGVTVGQSIALVQLLFGVGLIWILRRRPCTRS